MAITSATVETYLEAAITAFVAADYATARKNAKAARMALVRLPDYGTPEGANLRYRQDEIDKVLSDIADEESKTTDNKASRITYAARRNQPA